MQKSKNILNMKSFKYIFINQWWKEYYLKLWENPCYCHVIFIKDSIINMNNLMEINTFPRQRREKMLFSSQINDTIYPFIGY